MNSTPCTRRGALCVIVLIGCALSTWQACAQSVKEWRLQPITGNNPSYWAPEPNWSWGKGNPMTQDGATWQVMAQFEINPSLTSPYTNLVSGYYANYYRIWKGPGQTSTDPENQYRNFYLATRGFSNNVGPGYSTALLFTPPAADVYQFELAGNVYVQNPTAGWGKVTVYILAADGLSATQIAVFNLNKEDGYGNYPSSFTFDQKVKLAVGERFCLRVQTYNPSTASAGTSGINFAPESGGKFTVSIVPKGTVLAVR